MIIDVIIDQAWINLAADPTQAVSVSRRSGSAGTSVDGEVRTRAGGRRVGVTKAGRLSSGKLGFRTQDRAVIATLVDWAGQIVCIRDELGRRSFAMYFDVPEADLELGWIDVELAFDAVTYTEPTG